ncbi:MAG: 50S ribosomal protein L9 [Candidatus Omnitrophica bacterium]|nr:50S ribosomal protein L9 [Candidatus Omnitrophota bacterium]
MKVILIEDVKNVGSMGDIIDIKDGFARNFLFPKNLAKIAVGQNLKIVDSIKKKKLVVAAKEKKEAEAIMAKIAAFSCTIPMEAGEDDKLFGSVTSQDISRAFEMEGLNVEKRKIILEEPIKKLGVYNIAVKLHPEVTAEVKVWVVKK